MRCAISGDRLTQVALRFVLQGVDFPLDPRIARFLDNAVEYYKVTGSPITEDTAGQFASIVKTLKPLNDPSAPLWAIHKLEEASYEDSFAATLIKAMDVLKIGNDSGRGLNAAIDHLYTHMPTRAIADEDEEVDLVADYEKREQTDRLSGMATGYTVPDEATDGQEPGELWVVGAYTGQGKSFFLQNVAYNRRINEGLRGVFWSTEQTVRQIKMRLVVRHSRHEQFGVHGGIPYDDIKRARLDSDLRQMWLHEVIPDWEAGPYPELYLKTVPAGSSLMTIMRRTEELNRQIPIDYVIIDYLSQLRPSGKFVNEREAQTHLFIGAKSFALNFDSKRGVPVLTGAQTNPTSYLQACETGTYPLRAVADTAEAERSSDLLMFLLRRPEDEELAEVRAGILKNREGRANIIFTLDEDYGTAFLGDKTITDSETSTWTID